MKFKLLLLLLLISIVVRSQNLIPNPSFESINYCETRISCSPSAWYSVSNIPYGYQNDLLKPIDGKHSIAFLIAYEKEIRTYWQTMLLCNMQAGERYSISFNLYAPKIKFEPENLGIYLSDKLFHSKNDTIIQMGQTITIYEQNLFLLKKGWFKITLPYTATGKEKYLLLGNFNKKSNKLILKNSGLNIKIIEYYVDNFSLKPINKNVSKCAEFNMRNDSLYSSSIRHANFSNTQPTEVISNTQNLPLLSKADTLLLSKINFNFDSDKLLSTKNINKYFDSINVSTIDKIEIRGYTDSIGDKSYNLNLSQRRALSVKEYLMNTYKLPESLITAAGKGMIKDKSL